MAGSEEIVARARSFAMSGDLYAIVLMTMHEFSLDDLLSDVPTLPISDRGQITELRLAQVVAVVALATLGCQETQNTAVHEPNLLGLTAGANVVYPETGANPRDTQADTSLSRGLDMTAARKMIYEAAFTALKRGDGSSVILDCGVTHFAASQLQRGIDHAREKRRVAEQGGRR